MRKRLSGGLGGGGASADGLILTNMKVLELPPSESASSCVSFESRKGTCFDLPSTRAEMQLPSAESDRLILVASLSRSPLASVLACRSEPARSTRLSLPCRMWASPRASVSHCSTVMV